MAVLIVAVAVVVVLAVVFLVTTARRDRAAATGSLSRETLLRWYVLHVLMLPFVIVIFMAIHFWRVRKDGGISGPL